MQTLKKRLLLIDGKGYKSYKTIKGIYQFDNFTLSIDHVQGDPFAIPSRINVKVAKSHAGFPSSSYSAESGDNPVRRIALEDFLGRMINNAIKLYCKGKRGSGCSGQIAIECNGQKNILRNAVLIKKDYIEARLLIGLPADYRHVAGLHALEMLCKELPKIIEQSLLYPNLPAKQLDIHIKTAEDQDELRRQIKNKSLVAFIANGSNLPRQSGVSDKPLKDKVISFCSPPSIEYEFELPNSGKVKGMGIPEGITLIVGGGFHGKSTLLHALEHGVYNHIPGDGREKVVSNESAVKIRSEDGRIISNVNISPFIDNLPFARNTKHFFTENASGSTSQAANIIEAIECGTELLLIDEDTSATNFMIRDEKMQKLVSREKEPITPLLYRIRELYDKYKISSIIVMGGSGDYFDVADTVIMMDEYQPVDVSIQARELAVNKVNDKSIALPDFFNQTDRKPGITTLDASRGKHLVKIDVKETNTILYGNYRIDLSQVEQLVDLGQTRSIGLMIQYYAKHYQGASGSLTQNLKKIIKLATDSGLDIFSQYKVGNLALPRLYELAAAINRIRSNDWK